jgi:ParB family chromosome partitioning protein
MAEIVYIPAERLVPHPDNPRKDLGDLTELAASIKENGIFQNLTVVPEFEDRFTVIIGHRRLAAAKLAGLTELPCVVVEMTPKEQVQTMLLENMQRSDLTVYEQAQGFQMMLDLGATVEEIAEKSGFSEKTVRRRVKMMELDQDKLKEVSFRQLSLGDFDTLAQIEDIQERNKVLESIGTRDFDANVRSALRSQKERHNLPLVKAWLKEVGAKELKQGDTYGNKYESYDGRYSIYIAEWGEKGSRPPKVGKIPIFYTLDKWGTLRLYKKREKAKPEKKPPHEIAREKAVREAWALLENAAALAFDLRKAFVAQLTVTKKNRETVMYGALLAHLLEALEYNSPDRDSMCAVFGISTDGYDIKRGEKLATGLDKITDETLPRLIYAGFGDEKKNNCTGNYKGQFPEYKSSPKLKLLYEWLQLLGYEPSTEELQILSGAHEAFHAKEAYDATKQS